MSIEELAGMEAEFSQHLQQIKHYSDALPKSQKLRITSWLKKLCSVVDNVFWRKNRNLYTEVLAVMLEDGLLESPFDRSPPEGSLAKLNIYEIPFKIRNRLACEKKSENKENIDENNHAKQFNDCRKKKKMSAKFESLRSMNQGNEIEFEIETRRKKTGQNIEEKLIDTLEASLKFLAKNHEALDHYEEYRNILKETIEVSDLLGCNLREMKFSVLMPE